MLVPYKFAREFFLGLVALLHLILGTSMLVHIPDPLARAVGLTLLFVIATIESVIVWRELPPPDQVRIHETDCTVRWCDGHARLMQIAAKSWLGDRFGFLVIEDRGITLRILLRRSQNEVAWHRLAMHWRANSRREKNQKIK